MQEESVANALLLLLTIGYLYRAPLGFPLWVVLISVHILLANLKAKPASELCAAKFSFLLFESFMTPGGKEKRMDFIKSVTLTALSLSIVALWG